LPFTEAMAGWWWLYWRCYEARIPLDDLDKGLGAEAASARRWLGLAERAGFAIRRGHHLELTESGAFWLHLAQNYFALDYVNTLWTHASQEPWPHAVAL
jgi:hypothetical protein